MPEPKNELVATVIGVGLSAGPLTELAQSAKASRTEWLAVNNAADIFCTGTVTDMYATLRAAIGERAFDVIVQPVEGRRKKLLLADMESTIIEQEMLDELADLLGKRTEVAETTRRAMNGEIDFPTALKQRVVMLKGQSVKSLVITASQRITFVPGARALISKMRANGAQCWLVSGGFTCFAEPVANDLGFDRCFANVLVFKKHEPSFLQHLLRPKSEKKAEWLFTGKVADPILDKNSKKDVLQKAHAELGLILGDVLAVGDGANDIPMLEFCNAEGGLGIAFRAKPAVRAVTPHQINHGDLMALLYAQGYGWKDFVTT